MPKVADAVAEARAEIDGLLAGLEKLAGIESRTRQVGIHPDIAGFGDLSHPFDLRASVLAARATLECALERGETRGCHNRSDYREQDESLQINLVWPPSTGVARESIPNVDPEVAEPTHAEEIS